MVATTAVLKDKIDWIEAIRKRSTSANAAAQTRCNLDRAPSWHTWLFGHSEGRGEHGSQAANTDRLFKTFQALCAALPAEHSNQDSSELFDVWILEFWAVDSV